MSDFVERLLGLYVAVITLVSILGCAVFLTIAAQAARQGRAVDTTGHQWDEDLRSTTTRCRGGGCGSSGSRSSSRSSTSLLYPGLGDLRRPARLDLGRPVRGGAGERRDDLRPDLRRSTRRWIIEAIAAGSAGEGDGRAPLPHLRARSATRSDARGSKGFPNLTDNDWLWGGEPQTILTTIMDGRNGVMPPHGRGARRPRGSRTWPTTCCPFRARRTTRILPRRGKAKFATCAACHGPEAKGNPPLGAPNLTDKIWLYGGILAAIFEHDRQGPHQRMPAHKDFLGPSARGSSPPTSGACPSPRRPSGRPSEPDPRNGTTRAIPRTRLRHRPPARTSSRPSSRSAGRSTRARSTAWFAALALGRWSGSRRSSSTASPWVAWNDRQAVLFDLAARKFYIFGLVFWPQDFIYLTLLLVVVGRVALPLHRGGRPALVRLRLSADRLHGDLPVDRARDRGRPQRPHPARRGPARARARSASRRPSTLPGSRSRFWTGFTFVGYFTPIHDAGRRGRSPSPSARGRPSGSSSTASPPTATPAGCASRSASTCAPTRASRARCSTGTRSSSPTTARAASRAARAAGRPIRRPSGLGDCVDCDICVQVCPTGIDIRDGLQYECIGCAACIDGCDQVMDKMGYPQGLIRYSTENALQRAAGTAADPRAHRCGRGPSSTRRSCSPYHGRDRPALCMRVPLKVDVIRDRARLVARGRRARKLENVYRLQVMNTQETPHRYRHRACGPRHGRRSRRRRAVEIPAASHAHGAGAAAHRPGRRRGARTRSRSRCRRRTTPASRCGKRLSSW